MAARWCALAAVGCVLALTCSAGAQQDASLRIYEEQLRYEFDRQAAGARAVGADGGGWFTFAYFHFDDESVDRDRTLRQYEVRGWASFSLHDVHRAYVRGVKGWDDWNHDDDPDGDTERACRLERAWYELDFEQYLRQQTGEAPENWFRVKVGREYTVFGTGLALSLPLDAVLLTANVGDFQVQGLIGQTVYRTSNIDPSFVVSDHMERCFWGVQGSYEGFSRHRPFAYFLSQADHTEESPELATRDYDYDSRYIGAGSTGTIGLPDLSYLVEAIGQLGRGYASDGRTREDICAMALDAQLEYIWTQTPFRPGVQCEYLLATGDPDRALSAVATDGGNRPGTRDEAFNGFGFRDTGIAFAPRISNLHMFMVGGSFRPFGRHEFLSRLEVGSRVFFYMKQRRDGAIGEFGMTDDSRFLGWEPDVYLNWRILSDVSLTVRYGAFQPNDAFEDRDWRHFVFAGVTYSF